MARAGDAAELQSSFAELDGRETWRLPSRSNRGWDRCRLSEVVLEELRDFELALQRQGQVRDGSARAYRKALGCVAKQAQRFLGRPLVNLGEIYQVSVIAAVAADDEPFDEITPRLSKYALRQRRVALRAYLRAVGLPAKSYEEGASILDNGFRRAAHRRGFAYAIASGRRPGHHLRPRVEDVEAVIAVARASPTSFVGRRNAAFLRLALHTGLRAGSILGLDGADLSWRRERVFAKVREKGRAGKREIEVPGEVVPELLRYVEAFNGEAASRGWAARVGIGLPGAFWRGTRARPWTYGGALAMVNGSARIAGVPHFHLHGIRHLRAAVLARHLAPEEAALAGGWRNTGVFLGHYTKGLWEWLDESVPVPQGVSIERQLATGPVP